MCRHAHLRMQVETIGQLSGSIPLGYPQVPRVTLRSAGAFYTLKRPKDLSFLMPGSALVSHTCICTFAVHTLPPLPVLQNKFFLLRIPLRADLGTGKGQLVLPWGKTKYWIGRDGRGFEAGREGEYIITLRECIMWLQERQLKTGLGKEPLRSRHGLVRSEATECHPAVLAVLTATHHSISRARGCLGVMSTDSSMSMQRPPGHTRSPLLTARLVRVPCYICA